MEFEAVTKKWGKSLAIIIPEHIVKQEKIKKPVDFFAFPYGTDVDISHETLALTKEMYGFSFLLLAGKNYFAKPDRHLIKRTGVNPRISTYHLRALMTGVKDFVYERRIRKLKL